MKKIMLLLMSATVLLVAPSCKKGENDPALSLKSRKKRVDGVYVVSKLESELVGSDGNSESMTKRVYDGASMSETVTIGGVVQNNLITVNSADWSFDKDGTWEMVWDETKTTVDDGQFYKTTTIENYNKTQSGTWAFLGKTKDQSKNKERIQLSVLKNNEVTNTKTDFLDKSTNVTTSSTVDEVFSNTYLYLENVIVYNIDMLKNKEMVFKLDNSQNEVSSYDDGTSTYTYSYTTRYTETMTLIEE